MGVRRATRRDLIRSGAGAALALSLGSQSGIAPAAPAEHKHRPPGFDDYHPHVLHFAGVAIDVTWATFQRASYFKLTTDDGIAYRTYDTFHVNGYIRLGADCKQVVVDRLRSATGLTIREPMAVVTTRYDRARVESIEAYEGVAGSVLVGVTWDLVDDGEPVKAAQRTKD